MAKFAEGLGGSSVIPPNIQAVIDAVWPLANAAVQSAAVIGDTLYVGGGFTDINGTTRNRLAAFDIPTKTLLAWNPNANSGSISAMAAAGGQIWVGGSFTNVGGQARNRLAVLDATTGLATAFASTPSATVTDMVADATHVYIGGSFLTVDGQARVRLAQYLIADGSLTAWNYVASPALSSLDSMAVSDGALVVNNGTADEVIFIDKVSAALLNRYFAAASAVAASASTAFFNTGSTGFLVKTDGDGSNPEIFASGCGPLEPIFVEATRVWISCSGFMQGVSRAGLALFDITTKSLLRETVFVDGNQISGMVISATTVILIGSMIAIDLENRKRIASFPNFTTSTPVGV